MITSRYLKSSDYTSACDVLYNGALLLLRAGQGGSGGDLAMMLLNEVYNKGEFACNDENKKRLCHETRSKVVIICKRQRIGDGQVGMAS